MPADPTSNNVKVFAARPAILGIRHVPGGVTGWLVDPRPAPPVLPGWLIDWLTAPR